MARVEVTLADLPGAVGRQFGPGPWYRVGQPAVDLFAEATGDYQRIHNDVEWAESGPFAGTIAHGYLTLSLFPKLLTEVFAVTERGVGVNYGLDRVRFPRPVPVGARVRLEGRIGAVAEVPGGQQATYDFEISVEGDDERPACVARVIYRYLA